MEVEQTGGSAGFRSTWENVAIVGLIMLTGGEGINGEQGGFYNTCYTEHLKIDQRIRRLIFCVFLTVNESNKRLKDT